MADLRPTIDLKGRSDDFWGRLELHGSEVEQYQSLEDMSGAADAVILGRFLTIEAGRVFGDPAPELPRPEDAQAHYASVSIHITELLRGSRPAAHGDVLVLEILVPDPRDLGGLRATLPAEASILFLRNKGAEARDLGFGPDAISSEAGFYRLVTSDALLRDIDGRLEPIVWTDDAFLLQLAGRDAAEVIASIRRPNRP